MRLTHAFFSHTVDYFRDLSAHVNDELYDFNFPNFFQSAFPSQHQTATSPRLSSPSRNSNSNSNSHLPPPYMPHNTASEEAFITSLESQLRFWITSVHDSTIFEAWSRVVQKLMEGIYGEMEKLMNTFLQVGIVTPCMARRAMVNVQLSRDADRLFDARLTLRNDLRNPPRRDPCALLARSLRKKYPCSSSVSHHRPAASKSVIYSTSMLGSTSPWMPTFKKPTPSDSVAISSAGY